MINQDKKSKRASNFYDQVTLPGIKSTNINQNKFDSRNSLILHSSNNTNIA